MGELGLLGELCYFSPAGGRSVKGEMGGGGTLGRNFSWSLDFILRAAPVVMGLPECGGRVSSELFCLPGEKDTEGRGREEETGCVRKRLYQHITSRENRVPGLREGLGVRWNKCWVPCSC